jgi:hypothetical protein
MFVADKINLGNVGNGMRNKTNVFRRGADPPKKVSGSTPTDLWVDERWRYVKNGSGSCIAAVNFSNAELWISST